MINKNRKSEIGKGISALLGNITDEVKSFQQPSSSISNTNITGSIARVPIDQIDVNPKQPRRDFDETALNELAESIKLYDIIQPITVIKLNNTKYQIISGERRFRASKIAGLTDVPVFIRNANSQELLEMALIENLQRENLNAIEIALSYKQLMDECSLTQEEVAERMKKERSTVANYIRLLKLPPNIQAGVRSGEISMGHARCITGMEHIEQQLYVYNEILSKKLSVRQTENLVKDIQKNSSLKGSEKVSSLVTLSPAYKRIEDQMSSHLSTKVHMVRKKNGKGTITIEFYNDSDLERILHSMNV